MFSIERHQAILNLLSQLKSVTVKELSVELQTGEATIRRDLAKLEQSGLLKRTHGGAVQKDNFQIEIPLNVRAADKESEKRVIAEHASHLVSDGNFIIMDSSSTTLSMIPFLMQRKGLSILTNGAKTAIDLATLENTKVYSSGGLMRDKSLSFIGQTAVSCFNEYNADILFFSCRALSMEKGLSDFNEEEAYLRKVMMKSSKKNVLLCDHSKFNETSSYRIGSVNCVHTIITDQKPAQTWIDFLEEQGIELIYE